MNKKDILSELKWRGIISNITDEEKFLKLCEKDFGVYVGFDPSFKSLHLGNYIMIRMIKMFKKYGFKTIALVGGATGMIGDPSGKSTERNLLDDNLVKANVECIKKQLEHFAKPDKVFNNYEIWSNMNVITYLRDVGKMFNVNVMLEKDIVKNRLESGISYTEFSYSILQSYDWVQLFEREKIAFQLGGSDQWGNITAGTNIFRKIYGEDHDACGLTINLLTKSDGKKFGKSEKGAIYLDPEITSPNTMYNFCINQQDNDLEKLFKFLTDLTKDEIEKVLKEHNADPRQRIGQTRLAKEIVSDIHGENEYEKAKATAKLLFEEKYDSISPSDLLSAFQDAESVELTKDTSIIDLLVESGFMKSKREVRDLISQNGLKVNGNPVNDENFLLSKSIAINKQFFIIKKGKKNFYVVMVK